MAWEGIREQQSDEDKINRMKAQLVAPLFKGADEKRIDEIEGTLDKANFTLRGLSERGKDFIVQHIKDEFSEQQILVLIQKLMDKTGGTSQTNRMNDCCNNVFPKTGPMPFRKESARMDSSSVFS